MLRIFQEGAPNTHCQSLWHWLHTVWAKLHHVPCGFSFFNCTLNVKDWCREPLSSVIIIITLPSLRLSSHSREVIISQHRLRQCETNENRLHTENTITVPSSMSGGRPPTNTFLEKCSSNCAWAAWELGDSCGGEDKLGTVWSNELLLLTEKTSPIIPKGDFSAHNRHTTKYWFNGRYYN